MSEFTTYKVVNMQRIAVLPGELLVIVEGFAMVCECAEFPIDGFVTIDGELRIG
jgi:hypothetical protein